MALGQSLRHEELGARGRRMLKTRTMVSQKRKTPHCQLHNMSKKVWVTVAPETSCVKTVMDCPAERVLRGWISEGTSQPKGPQA
jgi:hypothetical protein